MIRATALAVAPVVAALLLAGCSWPFERSYPEKQRYVIRSQRDTPVRAGDAGVLRVERLRVATIFERKGFVYRTGEVQYVDDFYNVFYAQPGTLIRSAIREWLERAGIFSAVVDAAQPAEPDWLLEGQVWRLYGDFRDPGSPRAVIDVELALLDARSPRMEAVLSERYSREIALPSAAAPELVEAWNAGMVSILEQLEADLRERLAARRP